MTEHEERIEIIKASYFAGIWRGKQLPKGARVNKHLEKDLATMFRWLERLDPSSKDL